MAWDSVDLLPGLRPAMFRGVSFHMPDASHEVGRRIVVTLFPGIDAASFEDLGRHDGPIFVSGILLGDDYVNQALALQAAFQTAGPGTLMHPWLGEMSVIVADPGQIRFAANALRLVQFDVSFLRADIASGFGISTLAGLLSSIAALIALPAQIIGAVVGAATMAVGTWAAIVNTASSITSLVEAAVASSPAAAELTSAIEPASKILNAALGGAPGAASSVAVSAALGALVAPIATVAIGADEPAIGASSTSSALPAIDARAGAALLLALAADIHAIEIFGVYDGVTRLAVEIAALAHAVRCVAEIDFESRQDAADWRDQVGTGIDRAMTAASTLAPLAPASAALAMNALSATSAALGRDMNEIIGRLPSVYRLAPAGTVSAWLIAQHLAGDDASAVTAMLDDIVRRNRLRHPALVTPDGVEVLM